MGAGFYDHLIELLKQYNCVFVRQGKGSHEVWYSPITEVNFPVSKNIDSRHTANGILKQAGIPKYF